MANKKEKSNVKKVVESTSTKVENKTEKKSMKNQTETRRFLIVLGILAILLLIVMSVSLLTFKKSHQIITDVKSLLASDTGKLVYIVRNGCSYCELNEANMKSMKDEYNLDYYQVDISDLTKDDEKELLSLLSIDSSKFGTPYLVDVEKDEVKGALDGVKSFDEFFKFLQTNGFIAKDQKLLLNYINYSQYKNIIKSKSNQIVVLAASTCHYCLSERPILDEIAKEYKLKINYLNVDTAFDAKNEEAESKEFNNSLKWFSENTEWGTPTTLIVNDSKVVSALTGYREKEEVIKFYQQNGFIEG